MTEDRQSKTPRVEPRIFKGTRDFLPDKMRVRRFVTETLRSVFESYGFEPLETPTIEFLDVLTGKSGQEADRLIFPLAYEDGRTLALRYDLTVPLSRVVAMYGKSMAFPFKRYQMQPVWRADKPQKGRYREFLQCDVDTIGTSSMAADAEILQLACEGLSALGFSNMAVELNDRKIINGLYRALGIGQDLSSFVSRTVDKIAKVGRNEVERILREGDGGEERIAPDRAARLIDLMDGGDLDSVSAAVRGVDEGEKGVSEIREILGMLSSHPVASKAVVFTPSMVRGLDYYTGPIFEAVVKDSGVGSVGGGGRYDGLIGIFSGESKPAVGYSFGVERLIDSMEDGAFNRLSPAARRPSDVLVTVFSQELLPQSCALAAEIRAAGLRVEVFLDPGTKLGRQFAFADRRGIPVAVTIGPDEIAKGLVSMKLLSSGVQETVARAETPARAKVLIEGA